MQQACTFLVVHSFISVQALGWLRDLQPRAMFATDFHVTEEIHVLFLQSSHDLIANTLQRDGLASLAVPFHPSLFTQHLAQVAAVLAAVTIPLFISYEGLFGLRIKHAKRPPRKLSRSELFWTTLTFAAEWFLTDQFLPSIPEIAAEFQVPETSIGATLQFHQAASGLFTLLFAPLSDRIGRRPVILGGQLLLIVSTLCAGSAPSYPWFVLGRVLQGVSNALGAVFLAMLRDCYDDETERAGIISIIAAISVFAPILAPGIGALLASWMGWRFSFFVMIPIIVLSFAFTLQLLEETVPENAGQPILMAAKRALGNRRRVLMLLTQSVLIGMLLFTGTIHAVNLQDVYGLPLLQCALIMSCLGLPAIVSAAVGAALGWNPRQMYSAMCPLLALSGLVHVMIALFASQSLSLYIFAYIFLSAWPVHVVIALGTEFPQEMPDIAGAAGAFFSAGPVLGGAMLATPGMFVAKQHGTVGTLLSSGAYLLMLALGCLLLILSHKGGEDNAPEGCDTATSKAEGD